MLKMIYPAVDATIKANMLQDIGQCLFRCAARAVQRRAPERCVGMARPTQRLLAEALLEVPQ